MPKQVKQYLIEELTAQFNAANASKDILIVVHDQLEYTKKCLESVFLHTKTPFTVHLWDNDSKEETRDWLIAFAAEHDNVVLRHCHNNIGFIVPNNRMTAMSDSDYVILLNNDTEVMDGWDMALLGWLQANPDVALVGYQGGILNKEGMGVNVHNGDEIDFVQGWCMCFERKTFHQFGLFDEEHLDFAYGEDADFSLRLKEAGRKLYALNVFLVKHHANKTTTAVKDEIDMTPSFTENHRHLHARWGDYLSKNRVLLNYPEIEEKINQQWKEQRGEDLSVESLVKAALL